MAPHAKAAVAVAELAPVRPALLKSRAAATYIGLSDSSLRAMRFGDVRSLRDGKAPTGPRWICLGSASTVFYRVADLDAWIEANAIERGVLQLRGAK